MKKNLLELKWNAILEDLEVELVDNKCKKYKYNWLDHVSRMEHANDDDMGDLAEDHYLMLTWFIMTIMMTMQKTFLFV
jgi:hypothetical protein